MNAAEKKVAAQAGTNLLAFVAVKALILIGIRHYIRKAGQ